MKNPIDWEKFDELASQGLQCKDIAKHFNIDPREFGIMVKKHLGIYPSQYIHQKKYPNLKRNYG